MKMVMDGEIIASFFPIIWETFVVTISNFVPNGSGPLATTPSVISGGGGGGAEQFSK